jgi:hypothetical protein
MWVPNDAVMTSFKFWHAQQQQLAVGSCGQEKMVVAAGASSRTVPVPVRIYYFLDDR